MRTIRTIGRVILMPLAAASLLLSVQTGVAGAASVPMDQVSLNYTKIEMAYSAELSVRGAVLDGTSDTESTANNLRQMTLAAGMSVVGDFNGDRTEDIAV